jgi:hypothetical protein
MPLKKLHSTRSAAAAVNVNSKYRDLSIYMRLCSIELQYQQTIAFVFFKYRLTTMS